MDNHQRKLLIKKIKTQFDEHLIDNDPYAEFLMTKIIRLESMASDKLSFNQDEYIQNQINAYSPVRAQNQMEGELIAKQRSELARRRREKHLNESFDEALKKEIEAIVTKQLEIEARENKIKHTTQDIMAVIVSQGESNWNFTSKELLKGFAISTIKQELYGAGYEGTDTLFVLDVDSLSIHEEKEGFGGSFTLTLNAIDDCTLDYFTDDRMLWSQLFIDSKVVSPHDRNTIDPKHVLMFGRALIADFLSNTVQRRQSEYEGYIDDDALDGAGNASIIENRLRQLCNSILFIHQGFSCSGVYTKKEQ